MLLTTAPDTVVPPPKLDVPAAIPGLTSTKSTALRVRQPTSTNGWSGPRWHPGQPVHRRQLRRGESAPHRGAEPLTQWAEQTDTPLITVEGLSVSSSGGGAYGPGDIPELRQQTAHYDVTPAVPRMINYARTGAKETPDQPVDPVVPATPEQVDALAGQLRTNRVYDASGRTDPVDIPTELVTRQTGLNVRVAAFPPLAPGQPLVDYAPALAKQFPGDEIFVSYDMWLDVAGPDQAVLESARDYAHGESASFEHGVVMSDRIATL